MKAIKILWKILQGALLVVLSLLLLSNLWLLGAKAITGEENPTVFGYSWAVVLSGSMEPEIQINDLVVSHRQDEYEIGDIITFDAGTTLTTHRIVGETETSFTTKGDANNTEDTAPVTPEQIVGKVVLTISGIGSALSFMKTPLGMLCIVLFGLLLIELPWFIERAKQKDKKTGRM